MSLLDDIFRAAGAYHAAFARHCNATRAGRDLEATAQDVVGESLRYRIALDKLIMQTPEPRIRGHRLRGLPGEGRPRSDRPSQPNGGRDR